MDRLTFLGTGDSLGVPRVYCDCTVCSEARETGRNRRLRASVRIETGAGTMVLDCGPDWKEQMERLQTRKTQQVLLTHAHFDHMAGLPEWADACRWLGEAGHLYAPSDVLDTIRRQFPWLENNILYHEIDGTLSFGDWEIVPHRVCHGKNGFSYAYRWSKPGFSWAYCPDAINLDAEQKAFLHGLDLLILGTSYYREEFDFTARSVYDMVEALALLDEIRPDRTVFTHMSHGVDVRSSYGLPDAVTLAEAGMTLELGKP